MRYRPRRLREHAAVRALVAQTRLHAREMVLPLFVKEGLAQPAPIASMPGVVHHSLDSLRAAVAAAAESGVGGVMLFGVPAERDPDGSGAADPEGILNRALRAMCSEVGDALVVMSDVCLDEFTDHGHCGVLGAQGRVDNDVTVARYTQVAVAQATAGAHMVAPSGMMDGQVGAIRGALDAEGFEHVGVLAYTAKYASSLYGPFRDAVQSTLEGDRRTYQMDPANRREALREAQLDIDEGADMVMVKPAWGYLDIVSDLAGSSTVPVAAYQVSGEYAMLEAAARDGVVQRRAMILESLMSIKRAGASVIVSYWAQEVADWLQEKTEL